MICSLYLTFLGIAEGVRWSKEIASSVLQSKVEVTAVTA